MNDKLDDSSGANGADNERPDAPRDGRSSRRVRRLKRIGLVLGAFALLLAVLVFVLPTYAARWMLASTAEDLGIEATGVGTVKIDLWNREVSFGPVTIGRAGSDPAVIDRFGLSFSGSQILDRRGFGKRIIISGVSLDISSTGDGGILVNGIDMLELADRFSTGGEPEGKSDAWGLGVRSLELRDSAVHVRLPEDRTVDLDVAVLNFSGFRTWQPEEPGQFQLEASINEIGIKLEGQAWPFAETIRAKMSSQLDGVSLARIERVTGRLAGVEIDGALRANLTSELVIEQNGRIVISHDGRIETESLNVALPEGRGMSLVDGEIRLENVATIRAQGTTQVTGSVSVSGTNTQVTPSPGTRIEIDELALDLENFRVIAGQDLATSGSFNAKMEARRGRGVIAGSQGAFALLAVTAETGAFSWAPGAPESWAADVSVIVEQSEFEKMNGDRRVIASFDSLDIRDASIDQTLETTIGSVVVETLSGTLDDGEGGEKLRARFNELSLRDLSLTPEGAVRAGDVALAGLDAKATFALVKAPSAGGAAEPSGLSQAPNEPTDDKGTSSAAGMTVSVGRFRISDLAKIELVDESFSPATKLSLAVESLQLEELDTADPEARARFALTTAINEFARFEAEGWVERITDPSDFELTSKLERLELPAFSPFAAKHLGFNLEKGRLSADVRGRATDGVLDVGTDIEILNLEFSPLSAGDAERFSAAAGVPVELAVDLLEDPNGLISLSIPITGNIDKPDFELSAVISKAVGNAIAGAVSTTIKLFFPPALLISLVSSDGLGGGADFATVPFDAGSLELQADGRALLGGMAKLLQQRPGLMVTVCGRTTSEDLRAALSTEIERIVAERRAAHEREMDLFRNRLQPFVARGIADSDGQLLVSNPPDAFPRRPEAPNVNEAELVSELAAARADVLRTSLTQLAAGRTVAIRRALRESGLVDDGQIAECRPVYDPADTAGPRAIVEL